MITEIATTDLVPKMMNQIETTAITYLTALNDLKVQIDDVKATKINLQRCKKAADDHASVLERYKSILASLGVRK